MTTESKQFTVYTLVGEALFYHSGTFHYDAIKANDEKKALDKWNRENEWRQYPWKVAEGALFDVVKSFYADGVNTMINFKTNESTQLDLLFAVPEPEEEPITNEEGE